VIVRAITRASWASAGVLLVATALMVFDVYAAAGQPHYALAANGFLLAQLIALLLMYLRPRLRAGIVFIVVSVISIAGYQYVLLTAGTGLGDSLQFLLNRPVLVIV